MTAKTKDDTMTEPDAADANSESTTSDEAQVDADGFVSKQVLDDAPPENEPPAESRIDRRKAAADERARAQRDEATARAEAAEAKLAARDQEDAIRMAGRLVDPTDLFRGGITLEDLRDEDGVLDPTLVQAAVADIAREHPHWAKQAAAPASMVTDGAAIPDTRPAGNSFVDAFRPKPNRE